MPGLSFVCEFDKDLKLKEAPLVQSLLSLVHSDQYRSDVLYHDKSFFLGISGYEEYPFSVFQNDNYCIYLEGKIYNKDQSLAKYELQELADQIFHKDSYIKAISYWLLNTDGDFIVIILEKRLKRAVIFNDILGRLPLYYHKTSKGLCVSREIQFIRNMYQCHPFDRMAVAQYLLFGYPLANRTLFENINRIQPATLIKVDLLASEIKMDNIHTFNFDNKLYENQPFIENVKNLSSLFLEATKNRASSAASNVIAFSGGLDSRAVGAALHKLNIPYSGATYLDYAKKARHDARVAEKLANIFHIPWKLFLLGPPTKEDALELLKIKSGLNSITMSYILSFFRNIKEYYGNEIQYFTGDGGDKTLRDLRPAPRISNSNELVDLILKNNQIFSLNKVSKLTHLEEYHIISELKDRVENYPEKDLQNKYVHFLIFERGLKWLFEGEDRNRFYFWSLTPFYSIEFFMYAMNCPDSMKGRYRLYREFLSYLSAEAAAIENANWQFPITSKGGLFLYESVYPLLPLKVKGLIRNALKKKKIFTPLAENRFKDIENQISRCVSLENYLCIPEIRRLENISQYQFDLLFTLTSAIEEFECPGG